MRDLFDSLPLWATLIVTLAIVLLAVETGFRAGLIRQGRAQHEKEAPVGIMVGATLGLLAFLLAFTFGIAANLFQSKRDVMLEEANAIGTAYLRADLLPESHAADVRALFREYVDLYGRHRPHRGSRPQPGRDAPCEPAVDDRLAQLHDGAVTTKGGHS